MGTCGMVGATCADTATAEPSSLLLNFSESSSLGNQMIAYDLYAKLIYAGKNIHADFKSNLFVFPVG